MKNLTFPYQKPSTNPFKDILLCIYSILLAIFAIITYIAIGGINLLRIPLLPIIKFYDIYITRIKLPKYGIVYKKDTKNVSSTPCKRCNKPSISSCFDKETNELICWDCVRRAIYPKLQEKYDKEWQKYIKRRRNQTNYGKSKGN